MCGCLIEVCVECVSVSEFRAGALHGTYCECTPFHPSIADSRRENRRAAAPNVERTIGKPGDEATPNPLIGGFVVVLIFQLAFA